MSRTTTMKFAGACALAMSVASAAFAHGGGMGGGMGGAIKSHPQMPMPVSRPSEFGTRPSTGNRELPTQSVANPAAVTRVTPVTGTRLPALQGRSPTESGKTPTTTAVPQIHKDPPPPGGNQ